MNAQDALHDLFLVDQQVRGLESRLIAARKRVQLQVSRLEKLTRQRDELATQHQRVQTIAADLEGQSRAIEDKINKFREQMNTARTNKEYSAFLVEINTIKNDKGKLEEQAIEQLTAADGLKARIIGLEAEMAEVEKIKSVADRELADRHAEVGVDLDELKAKRAEAAKAVDAETLNMFDRLSESTDGEALAVVEETDRRRMEYICSGCYMQLPVEKLNLLLSASTPVRCPSCGRFLYLDKELRSSFA